MSLRRLTVTTAVMAVVALLLVALTPSLPDPSRLVTEPQAVVDTAGPESLVLAAAALLAWLAWGWGAVGLVLTGLSAAPGLVGALARGAARLLLPADARRAAALALGLGLAVGSPALSACSTAAPAPAAAVTLSQAPPVPDWPVTPGRPATGHAPAPPPAGAGPVPEWPAAEHGTAEHASAEHVAAEHVAAEHVVVRGDSLWLIASADLRARTGAEPTAADAARAVSAWWSVNAHVIGPDPDLLLPGQVLRAPAAPSTPVESESLR